MSLNPYESPREPDKPPGAAFRDQLKSLVDIILLIAFVGGVGFIFYLEFKP